MYNMHGDITKVICNDLNLEEVVCTSSLNNYNHLVTFETDSEEDVSNVTAFLLDTNTGYKYVQNITNFSNNDVSFLTEARTHENAFFDAIQIEITYQDSTIINLKKSVKKKGIKNVQGNLTFSTGEIRLLGSNLLYPRIKVGFPKWGSVEKNDISTTTKIFEPLFAHFYDSYHKIIKLNLYARLGLSYKKIVPIFLGNSPLAVIRHKGEESTKLYEGTAVERYPTLINQVPTSKTRIFSRVLYNPSSTTPLYNYEPFLNTYLYVQKSTIEESETKSFARITGHNIYGEYQEEVIQLQNNFFVMSTKKFKKIISITSNVSFILSNYIDCRFDHYVIKDIKTVAPIVNKELLAFYPKILISKNNENNRPTILVHDTRKELSEVEYKFDIETETGLVTSLYVDEHLRVLWTDGKFLYSGVLSHDLSKDVGNHPSNNNNNVIKVNDKNTSIGDWIDVSIDTEEWPSNTPMLIQIKNGDTIKYYDQETEEFLDDARFSYVVEDQKYIEISVKVDNENPYVFSVISDDFSKRYVASSHTNMIKNVTKLVTEDPLVIVDNQILTASINNTAPSVSIFNQDSDKIQVTIFPLGSGSFNWEFVIEGHHFGNNGATYPEELYNLVSSRGENNLPVVFEFNRVGALHKFDLDKIKCNLNLEISNRFTTPTSVSFKVYITDVYGSFNKTIVVTADKKVTLPITFTRNTKEINNAI